MKTLLTIILVIIVIAAVFLFGKFGFGSGKYNKNGDIPVKSSISAVEDDDEPTNNSQIQTSEIITTEKVTVPSTEKLTYIELTVDGNEYIFKSHKYSISDIESLIDEIQNSGSVFVKLIDDEASEKAYISIISALKSKMIEYFEE